MIDLTRLTPHRLASEPYQWAFIDGLFSPPDAAALAASFPRDHFKTVTGDDGEKSYEYEARALILMGAGVVSRAGPLSPAWRQLGADLLSPAYHRAMSQLTGLDLERVPMEASVFHYGRRAWLGPHVDLPDKLVTHVFYFNETWREADGGCLTILRSGEMNDVAQTVLPLIGNSAALVRSRNSWHAVSRVRDDCRISRRSLTVTFYRPGSPSTLWPAGDATPLHDYRGERSALARWAQRKWQRLRR